MTKEKGIMLSVVEKLNDDNDIWPCQSSTTPMPNFKHQSNDFDKFLSLLLFQTEVNLTNTLTSNPLWELVAEKY